jgi:hypothetical protein
MFAIGFLSLLSIGFVTMAASGDDDMSEMDQADEDQDDLGFNDHVVTRGDVEISYTPGEDEDTDTQEKINGFVEGVQDNPQQDIGDVVDDLHEFLGGLEEGDDDETEETPASQNASEDGRPPMGDGYRDPLIIAEELDAQRILDEIAAEEARQPINLVTVSDSNGEEVPDEQVLEAQSENATDTDPAFIVKAPDADNYIEVGYDEEHTFQIEYNGQTVSVTAGLNSNIEGPEGDPQQARSTTEDEDGNVITEYAMRNTFEGSTDITIDVTPDQIGNHVAQITLINPVDTLDFNFDSDVKGNFHLVFHEMEDGEEGDTSTTKRAFVVQTAPTQASLSATEINQVTEQGLARTETTNVLGEIYLGSESLYVQDGSEGGDTSENWINAFINDNPMITSNLTWASVVEHAEDAGQTEPENGSSNAGTPGMNFPTLDFPTLDFAGF